MRSWAEDFRTYDDACRYYGVDTPDQIAAEMAFQDAEDSDRLMDSMSAGVVQPGAYYPIMEDECPF